MGGVFTFNEVKNSDDRKINYCSDKIRYCNSEIKNSGEGCV